MNKCKCDLCSGGFEFGCGASPSVIAYYFRLLKQRLADAERANAKGDK